MDLEKNEKIISKLFSYSYEEYEDGDKSSETMIQDILNDPDFLDLKEIVIGDWGDSWDDSCQAIIDGIVENADKFSQIESLFIGDMSFEQCEVSWIIQGNYSKLWAAMPQLKNLMIKGSQELELGEICHENLEALTIICGGLPKSVIKSIQKAKLPNLKKLLLYIGVENYGFDGDESTIKELLKEADFPNLIYLGIVDSEIQDELTEIILESKFIDQITVLDLSLGTLTDKGGELLLEKIPSHPNIKKLNLHYNYLSDEMAKKLEEELQIEEIDVSEREKEDNYGGEIYRYPMLTE